MFQDIIKLKFEESDVFAEKGLGDLSPLDSGHENRYFSLIYLFGLEFMEIAYNEPDEQFPLILVPNIRIGGEFFGNFVPAIER